MQFIRSDQAWKKGEKEESEEDGSSEQPSRTDAGRFLPPLTVGIDRQGLANPVFQIGGKIDPPRLRLDQRLDLLDRRSGVSTINAIVDVSVNVSGEDGIQFAVHPLMKTISDDKMEPGFELYASNNA